MQFKPYLTHHTFAPARNSDIFLCFCFQNWEVMNTAVLTGRQVSQAMKVFIVSQAGTVADVTLQSSCHSEDESVLKVSDNIDINAHS